MSYKRCSDFAAIMIITSLCSKLTTDTQKMCKKVKLLILDIQSLIVIVFVNKRNFLLINLTSCNVTMYNTNLYESELLSYRNEKYCFYLIFSMYIYTIENYMNIVH